MASLRGVAGKRTDRRTLARAAAVLAVSGALAVGCATVGDPGVENLRTSGAVPPARAVPATAVAVTTQHPVTVLDDGSGAELCLGMVLTSDPPQCGGPRLVGWDWSAHSGQYAEKSGVRWGSFLVAGHFDPATGDFFPDGISDGRDHEPAVTPLPDFSTPCPAPDGGWRIVDLATTTADTMFATFDRAAQLADYAAAWMDQAPHPDRNSEAPSETAMNDPLRVIINVRVTGDPATAEATLREGWGGMLCVTRAERTEAELLAIVNEIATPDGSVLMAGPDALAGTVSVQVVYDDGTLQREYDQRYGPGLVLVTSALAPRG